MIKTIFFDVDGTLVSHKTHSVPDSTIEALKQLRANNIKLVLATERGMSELKNLPVKNLAFDGYLTLNGQLCVTKDNKLIFENPINPIDAHKIVEVFNKKALPLGIIDEKGYLYLNFINKAVRTSMKAVSSPIPPVEKNEGGKIYQFIAYGKGEEIEHLVSKLEYCKTSRWNEYAIDIIPADGGKLAGIKKYLSMNNEDLSNAMAFGDGENDIDMVRECGTGVAMGNSVEALKDVANYVTTNVDDDGILNACKFFKLI